MNNPYTHQLAERVHSIAADLVPVSTELVEWVISEALFQASIDLRRGRPAELEHIGQFIAVHGCGVAYRPADLLRSPLPITHKEIQHNG